MGANNFDSKVSKVTGSLDRMSQRLMKLPADMLILKEGELNLDMYKIVKGHAELYTGYETEQEVLLGIVGPGAVFGEFGLLLRKPAIYTVVSYSEIVLLRITENDLDDFVKNNRSYIVDIMRNMSNTMMVMQHQINLLTDEIKEGNKVDNDVIKAARRNLRNYTLNNQFRPMLDSAGKMRFIDRKR